MRTQQATDKKKIITKGVILCIIGTLLVGFLPRIFLQNMDVYLTNTPPLYPPSIVFPIAWSILYLCIGIAVFLVYLNHHDIQHHKNLCYIFYATQLFLAMLWPILFYGLQSPISACVCLFLLLVFSILTMYYFYGNNIASGILFTIYNVWLLYALYLNISLLFIN